MRRLAALNVIAMQRNDIRETELSLYVKFLRSLDESSLRSSKSLPFTDITSSVCPRSLSTKGSSFCPFILMCLCNNQTIIQKLRMHIHPPACDIKKDTRAATRDDGPVMSLFEFGCTAKMKSNQAVLLEPGRDSRDRCVSQSPVLSILLAQFKKTLPQTPLLRPDIIS